MSTSSTLVRHSGGMMTRMTEKMIVHFLVEIEGNVDRCLSGGSVDVSQNDDKNSLDSFFTKFN